ncbi:MAG: hypothetical protein HGA59_07580 [Chlorobiaceae bacterium]|nr:hypothetical protein [Chlorobiaceae bacterium]
MSRGAPYAILALVLMIFLSGADNTAPITAEEYYKNGKDRIHTGTIPFSFPFQL